MNKYFAKYLPKDTKQEEVSHVMYKGEVYRHHPMLCNKDPKIYTFIMKDGADRGYHEKWEDLIAVQLFLCSRDIQKGDKYLYESWDGFKEDTSKHDFKNDTNPLCFKVIGPICPKAIWVKEGDEFEENINVIISPMYERYSDPSLFEYNWVCVLCPVCKTFH